MAEDNKNICRRLLEDVMNRGKLSEIDKYVVPDCVYHVWSSLSNELPQPPAEGSRWSTDPRPDTMSASDGILPPHAARSLRNRLAPFGRRHGRGVPRAHTKLNRDVALKVLSPAFTADADRVARLEREARPGWRKL